MLSEKVVKLSQDKTYEEIERYLFDVKIKNELTEASYRQNIKRFFNVVKKKEVQYLTREDVQITYEDFQYFIAEMLENQEIGNATINHNVSAVAELMRYLEFKKVVNDISFLSQLKRLRLKEDPNSHAVISAEEANKMAELALEETNEPKTKYLLIKLAIDTCIRKSALLNLKWSNFEELNGRVYVKVRDKGNKYFKVEIAQWLFNELLTLKKEDSPKVFDISPSSVDKMMKRITDKMNFPKDKKVVFHSFRKVGANEEYEQHGDIIKTQKKLNHSNLTTTQRYLDQATVTGMGIISSRGGVDTEIYKDITHEELLKAIELLPQSAKFNLALKIKEVINN